MSCSRTQHGDPYGDRTHDLSIQSPTLYHQATALPPTQKSDTRITIRPSRSHASKVGKKCTTIYFFEILVLKKNMHVWLVFVFDIRGGGGGVGKYVARSIIANQGQ